MITSLDQPEHRLDAYLDGLLERDARDAFERQLASDAALRAEVAVQRRIDWILRGAMSAPAADLDRLPPAVRQHLEPSRAPVRGRTWLRTPLARRLAVAASIAVLMLSVWMIVQTLRTPSSGYQPLPWKPLVEVYRDKIADGYQPDWVCDDDEEFRTAFLGQYGQALQLDPLPGGVSAVGLCYANTISERTMMVLAKVSDEPVIVFVDRLDRDARQTVPGDSGLHLHRAVVGRLVLYELTPFGQPALLDRFFEPESGSDP